MALEHEIAQFGQRMGFANLPLSPDGTVALEIEGMGRLYLEQRPEELLLYLARPVPPHDRDMPRRILALCHYGKEPPSCQLSVLAFWERTRAFYAPRVIT